MIPGRPVVRASAVDWIARAVVILASAWFLFAAAWGMFGMSGGGHIGAGSAATMMASEQIVLWKSAYPSWGWYAGVPPLKDWYVCHHPFGTFYLSAVFLWIFGHRDFVLHLPTVLMSAFIPWLLYGISRERWGTAVGAVAAAAYVVVPIAVGFSNYTNLETICIFGVLLFFWGHSRHMTTGRTRHLLASLVGLLLACSGDWVGYLLVTPLVVWAFLRAFVLARRLTPRFRFEPYARWWGLSVGAVAATLILWFGLFYAAGQIGQWLTSGVARSGGAGVPIKSVLDSRKNWIDFSFTPVAIFLGKAAAPVCLARLFILRRDEEIYALSVLFGGVVQYVAFYGGADVHIFWPHYFAVYYALALAQLVHSLAAIIGWTVRYWAVPKASVFAVIALVLGLAPTMAMAHDGVLSLWVWRRTGGRYDEKGRQIRSGIDMLAVLRQVVVPRTVRGTRIAVHESAGWGWEQLWVYQGEDDAVGMPSQGDAAVHPFWIARGSGLTGDLERKIASAAHVQVYGDVWLVDQRERFAPVDAYSMNEREPNALEWLLFDGTEPVRTIGRQPDPWLTWEWRTHLGQGAEQPVGEPSTLNQMRIAHNAAVARGEQAQAERWRERIEGQLDRTVESRFEQGVHLLGVRVIQGAQPRVESWFDVAAPIGELMFDVRSTMVARSPLSVTPPDTTDRFMAFAPPLPTKLWRPGFIYTIEVVLNHRIGRERYWGQWVSRDGSPAPRRLDGHPETTLVVVQ